MSRQPTGGLIVCEMVWSLTILPTHIQAGALEENP